MAALLGELALGICSAQNRAGPRGPELPGSLIVHGAAQVKGGRPSRGTGESREATGMHPDRG